MINHRETLLILFNSIDDNDLKNTIINNIKYIASLSNNSTNKELIEIGLSNKNLINFVGHKNSKYLSKFVKFLATTESIAIKDKVLEIVEKLSY